VKTQQLYTVLVETNVLFSLFGAATKSSLTAVTPPTLFLIYKNSTPHLQRQNPVGTRKK